MLVLHGFWSADGLSLWAEDSELSVKSASQALRAARRHPFAASAEVLAAIHAGKPGSAVVLLPSLRSSPLDSPELLRVTPRPAAHSEPVSAAVDGTGDGTSRGIGVGRARRTRSRRALRRVGHLSRRYSLSSRESWWRAGGFCRRSAWTNTGPSRSGGRSSRVADVVELNALVAAMPPVCRAESGARGAVRPGRWRL